ncbi:oxidized low-density lipoprotein receptor 1 [Ctenodactylus gundi]
MCAILQRTTGRGLVLYRCSQRQLPPLEVTRPTSSHPLCVADTPLLALQSAPPPMLMINSPSLGSLTPAQAGAHRGGLMGRKVTVLEVSRSNTSLMLVENEVFLFMDRRYQTRDHCFPHLPEAPPKPLRQPTSGETLPAAPSSSQRMKSRKEEPEQGSPNGPQSKGTRSQGGGTRNRPELQQRLKPPNIGTHGGLRALASRPWCPIALILGLLCLGLLVAAVMLGVRLSQVSDVLKQQQANLSHQEHLQEVQPSVQWQAENTSQHSQGELEEMIEILTQKLDEKSKKEMKLQEQNLRLQEALRTAANWSGSCPQDWIWHGRHCYLFSSESFNWEKSRENCLTLGAHLLKINSTDELEFVQRAGSHSSAPFWMGLSLRKPKDAWLWEDSSPLTRNLFRIKGALAQRYPSGTCAYIQQGVVFAENCILKAFGICQKATRPREVQRV